MKRVLCLLACLALSAPAFAQEHGMTMPADVYATLSAAVEKFPHTGDDEQRRVAMEKAVATVRAKHGPRWVWKTEHANLQAPSKDGLGYVLEGPIVHGQPAVMFIFDTINGVTRKVHAAPLISEPARAAYVLAVTPKDWLSPTPPAPTPPQSNLTEALLRELIEGLALLEADLTAARAELAELKARPVPCLSGRIGGFAPVTLCPK